MNPVAQKEVGFPIYATRIVWHSLILRILAKRGATCAARPDWLTGRLRMAKNVTLPKLYGCWYVFCLFSIAYVYLVVIRVRAVLCNLKFDAKTGFSPKLMLIKLLL
jgi:hypothetical protein